MSQTRQIERGVNPLFVERWSARAFDESTLTEAELQTVFEAARWAPSAYNAQPWRFLYARRGTPDWRKFLDFLIPYNRDWAQHASALIIALSARRLVPPGKTEAIDSIYHSHDTGAAVGFLVLQAHLSGLNTRIIGGFDQEKVKSELGVPDDYAVESLIVIGRKGKPETLSESFRAREAPSERLPLQNLVAEGRFGF
ncbi:MAG: nitroreductase family protein [Zoogloeaceae bacterium]|jgi:nitroreductase|nr:nitroreductase family protein [Zoogloeaceae bacterium]